MRLAMDVFAGIAGGALLGWGLDWLFGTVPVFLSLFLFLGTAAGVRNVTRKQV